jgi:iron complex outermembrane receptor protein
MFQLGYESSWSSAGDSPSFLGDRHGRSLNFRCNARHAGFSMLLAFRSSLLRLLGRPIFSSTVLALSAALAPVSIGAQDVEGRREALSDDATLRVQVMHEAIPVSGALVRSGRVGSQTDATGRALLRLIPGPHTVVVARIGFVPDTLKLSLAAGQDTSITVQLEDRGTELESVVVVATRSERRVEDTPIRVEVVDEEEVAEKVAMTPGDVSMLLNETSGLRVQTTSPSLGGAGVRVQGLQGRYTLLLADGLPLYGGQAGGLGLLQIPPVDLARVEVIKGSASALYGSNALGGVVNFISRRPGEEGTRELLINQTTRDGTDGVLFVGAPLRGGSPWGVTLLASAHRQRENDIDGDGWADMPGYRRAVVRPRLFYEDDAGRSLFATLGYTAENREGGTLDDEDPAGDSFVEGLRTRRADAGLVARLPVRPHDALGVRASATEQRHGHRFGPVEEDDVHRTLFGELSLTASRGRATWVAGAAFQAEHYRNEDVAAFDYDYRIPAVFGQVDLDVMPWLVLSASGRVDWHNVYGSIASPRASVLLRKGDSGVLADWTIRLSGGGGTFAPTPFTEETEATGLTPLRPFALLETERATGVSLDIGGPLDSKIGRIEVNGSVFGSRLEGAVLARDLEEETATGARRLELVNAPVPTRTWGAEALLRLVHDPFRATLTYAYTHATEWDPEAGGMARRRVPLVPRHSVGMVASIEEEDEYRVGFELYYTGRQSLDDNPYRDESRPYVVVGVLGERIVPTALGRARIFINAENLLDVRQTRVDPLLLPEPGMGGRRTTDVWSLLEGRTLNGGVRLTF